MKIFPPILCCQDLEKSGRCHDGLVHSGASCSSAEWQGMKKSLRNGFSADDVMILEFNLRWLDLGLHPRKRMPGT